MSPAFTGFLSALEQDLQPRNRLEKECIAKMAVARWRTMRVWGLEKAALEQAMATRQPGPCDTDSSTALAFRALCDDSRAAHLLNRYETCCDRQFARALNSLLEKRAEESAEFRANLVPDSNTDPQPPSAA